MFYDLKKKKAVRVSTKVLMKMSHLGIYIFRLNSEDRIGSTTKSRCSRTLGQGVLKDG